MTDKFNIITENWYTASDTWGRRMTGNFQAIDHWMAPIKGARAWVAGRVFTIDDIIVDLASNIVVKAAANFTVPADTTLFQYKADSTTTANITFADPSSVLYRLQVAAITLAVASSDIYKITGIATTSEGESVSVGLTSVSLSSGNTPTDLDTGWITSIETSDIAHSNLAGTSYPFGESLLLIPTSGAGNTKLFAQATDFRATTASGVVDHTKMYWRYADGSAGAVSEVEITGASGLVMCAHVQRFSRT